MNIHKLVCSYVKFQLMPLPIVGLFLTILGYLVEYGLIPPSFDIFGILYDPLFLSFLGIGSFLYIDRFYKDKLLCKCHNRDWAKKYHHLSGYVTGIIASFTAYMVPTSLLFIKDIDSFSSNSILSHNIEIFSITMSVSIGLKIFSALALFISKEIFEGSDPNSSLLFNRKPIWQQANECFIGTKLLLNKIWKS